MGDRAKISYNFEFGVVVRKACERELRFFLDGISDVTYTLKEYRGLLESKFRLIVCGPKESVLLVERSIDEWVVDPTENLSSSK